jgi:membrane protein
MEKLLVALVPNSGTSPRAEMPANPSCAADAVPGRIASFPLSAAQLAGRFLSNWHEWWQDGKRLAAYLLDSEVHTFAFSVAANAIISFIPFIVLLYALARSVFHSAWPNPHTPPTGMIRIINQMVVYFIPSNAQGEWLTRNLWLASGYGIEAVSIVLILVACTGIFLPLEVAFNKALGVVKSRNYLYNQTIALGLAVLMAVLGLASVLLNEAIQAGLAVLFFHPDRGTVRYFLLSGISYVFLAATTGVACIVFFFFIYWLLPNRKIPWRPVMRTAVITGVIWIVARVIFAAALPHINLEIYGPFKVSVGLLFWAYTSGLILFAGARFSVARICESDRKN